MADDPRVPDLNAAVAQYYARQQVGLEPSRALDVRRAPLARILTA